ncbi:MAG: DUF4254 domain-containing protein [Burkholderiaceae bacterium]|jgi:hypothetical protein
MSSLLLSASELVDFHDRAIVDPNVGPPYAAPLWGAIAANHRWNCLLWAQEDQARRRDVPDAEIAANKRAIDGYNQKRNDATEKVDELLLLQLAKVRAEPSSRLNSETAGSMSDRLSILALKVFHMHLQTERTDASAEHLARCAEKLALLREQRKDLAGCLDDLLADCVAGRAYFKVYRQFKMYNDPALNPYLYSAQTGSPP